MNFQTGDIANMMGLTNMGVIYLEKRGIIQSIRHENGYRAYDAETVSYLAMIRGYERIGFTISQAAELVKMSPDEIRMALADKKRELDRTREIIALLDERLSVPPVPAGELRDEDVSMAQCASFYYFPVWEDRYDPRSLSDEQRRALRSVDISWLSVMPVMHFCDCYTMEGKVLHKEKGNCIDAEAAHHYDVLLNQYVEIVPSRPCLQFLFRADEYREALLRGQRYLHAHGCTARFPAYAPLLNWSAAPQSAPPILRMLLPFEKII